MYTPGSFTKNFSWNRSFQRLHNSIFYGFSKKSEAVTRDEWRINSKIGDTDRQLIPLNFFLYSKKGISVDFVLVDTLVEQSLRYTYDLDFARLAMFTFHMANSGSWSRSKWTSGQVAGWANELIRDHVWKNGAWNEAALQVSSIDKFLDSRLIAKPHTKEKVRNNYRFMLSSAGLIEQNSTDSSRFRERSYVLAPQVFWDRMLFDGALPLTANIKPYEQSFMDCDGHKLLGCTEDQARAFVRGAFREYKAGPLNRRIQMLDGLKSAIAV